MPVSLNLTWLIDFYIDREFHFIFAANSPICIINMLYCIPQPKRRSNVIYAPLRSDDCGHDLVEFFFALNRNFYQYSRVLATASKSA